jgi:hypothetical protein
MNELFLFTHKWMVKYSCCPIDKFIIVLMIYIGFYYFKSWPVFAIFLEIS